MRERRTEGKISSFFLPCRSSIASPTPPAPAAVTPFPNFAGGGGRQPRERPTGQKRGSGVQPSSAAPPPCLAPVPLWRGGAGGGSPSHPIPRAARPSGAGAPARSRLQCQRSGFLSPWEPFGEGGHALEADDALKGVTAGAVFH